MDLRFVKIDVLDFARWINSLNDNDFKDEILKLKDALLFNEPNKSEYAAKLIKSAEDFKKIMSERGKRGMSSRWGVCKKPPSPKDPKEPKEEKEPKAPSQPKVAHGEFKNVFLTEDEYFNAFNKIPHLDRFIEKMSAYIAQHGKKYKNHYAALLNWHKMEQERKKEKEAELKAKQPKSFEQMERDRLDEIMHELHPSLYQKYDDYEGF